MHGYRWERKRRHAPSATTFTKAAAVLCMALLVMPPPLAWAAAPPPAPAAKKRVLVLKVQRGPDVGGLVTTRIQGYLDTIVSMDGQLEIVPTAGLVVPALEVVAEKPAKPTKPVRAPKPAKPPKPGTTKVAKDPVTLGNEASDAADKLLAKKRGNDAVKAYTKALGLYAQDLGHLEDFSRWTNALEGRAFGYFMAGYDDNGEEELGKLLAVVPEWAPPADAPPQVAGAVPRVKVRWKPTGAQIKVVADVRDATVLVDGVTRGKAPIMVGGLLPGDHVVRVVSPGRVSYGQLVTLGEASVEVQASMPEATATAPEEPPDEVTPTPIATPPVVPAPKLAPSGDDATGLEGFVRSGDYGAAFLAHAKKLAQSNRLDAVFMTYVRANGSDYDLGMFVWVASENAVAALDPARVQSDLTGLQVSVLELSDAASAAARAFPAGKRLAGRSPLYEPVVVARVEPPPTVVKHDPPPTKVEPPPTVVKHDPPPTVVKHDPPPTKVELPPTVVKHDPPPTKVEPPPTKVDPPPTVVKRDPPPKETPVTSVTKAPSIEPRVREGDKEDGPAVYETWWFWTLVVGAVGGGAAAIALTQDSGNSGPAGFRTTVSW